MDIKLSVHFSRKMDNFKEYLMPLKRWIGLVSNNG